MEDYKIDYSTHTGFPFYVMGYVPEWNDGVMTDFGANFKYVAVEGAEETSDVIVKTEGGVEYYKIALAEPGWHQYFIADGIPTELDGAYTIKAMVKASEACSINVNMGWGWKDGESIGTTVNIGTEWQEVEWEYTGIGGTSCNLVAQPGTVTATIEWKSVSVSHNQKEQRPVEWLEQLTNGDAEKSWADMGLADVTFNDTENNFKVCAWGKTKGRNLGEADANGNIPWNPFPADIEEVDGSHVFVVHAAVADTEGDASAWDNQFWIQSPKSWKSGTQIKIHFRYKASKNVTSQTQIHKQNPSDYLHWEGIGDVAFTTEWQNFDKTITFNDSQGTGWSVAFNLNSSDKEAIDFYFDDLSWQIMKLDEGYFVAASNTASGIEYDFDNATAFEQQEDLLVATVGTAGKKDTWVNELMISTVRGNDAAFKGATLKPSGSIVDDPDTWLDYTEASLAKIKLPAAGVWTISLDTENKQMNFVKVEGEEDKKPIDIKPNPTVVVVHGKERDDLTDGSDGTVNEGEGGTGQPWDNQFFIVANRVLDAGEETVIEFDYVGSVEAKTTTQCHGAPGAYIHWSAIGDVTFTTEEQHFSMTFTIPKECAGKDMKSIAFNMAEIKEACDYTIKNFVWKLADNTESLINQTGAENFWVKEGAGTDPHVFGGGSGISSISVNRTGSDAIYNLAGQRVADTYKGIVVKNGKKVVMK
ncbi:MAG: hypothetical protein K5764_03975 [Prevotella sp.]|nr:hypothetical protein [Prevotella sp.]